MFPAIRKTAIGSCFQANSCSRNPKKRKAANGQPHISYEESFSPTSQLLLGLVVWVAKRRRAAALQKGPQGKSSRVSQRRRYSALQKTEERNSAAKTAPILCTYGTAALRERLLRVKSRALTKPADYSAGGVGGFEIGREKSGAEVEAGKVYAGEIGFAEDGGGDVSAAEVRALHFGVTEIGGAKFGVAQDGVGEVSAKTFDAAELHAGHVGAGENGFGEVGAAEIGIFEIGAGEVSIAEARVGEIGLFEVGAAEESEGEIGSAEVGARQVGIGKVCAFAGGIAFDELGVGFENFSELFGFHFHSVRARHICEHILRLIAQKNLLVNHGFGVVVRSPP